MQTSLNCRGCALHACLLQQAHLIVMTVASLNHGTVV
jgi:hypothetical protein